MLADAGNTENELHMVKAERRLFVLPSNYIEGNMYLQQQRNDAIATNNKVGHPDLLVAMMSNPAWTKTTREL